MKKIVVVLTIIVALSGVIDLTHNRSSQAQGLPDLAITALTVSPTVDLQVYQLFTVTIQAQNVGNVSVSGRRVYLYIDPPDQPPLTTTQAIKEDVRYLQWPAGDSQMTEYSGFSFSREGVYRIYAWVDPSERIAETDESNNLKQIVVNVKRSSQDTPENEPNDDCNQAQTVQTDGTPYLHKFTPRGDVDWVKFSGTANMTYTITAAGIEADAEPDFEVWDSCGVPPAPAFGTRKDFRAPTSQDYYLKLENSIINYNPEKSRFRLTIQAAGSQPAGTPPRINGLWPATGDNDQLTTALITGTNFSQFPAMVALCPYEANSCSQNCVSLKKSGSWIDNNKFEIAIPTNLRPGGYCLAVTNPDGQADTLPQAFTVNAGQPDLTGIQPNQGYNNLSTELSLYGQRLYAAGLTVKLGNNMLSDVTELTPPDGTHLRATVPANLAPGNYDVIVTQSNGKTVSLPNGYTVLKANGDDLYAQAQELWVEPVSPQAGEKVQLRLLVHRQGDTKPLTDVPVRFEVNNQVIGTVNVPLIVTAATTLPLDWTAGQAGDIQITAIIDPDKKVPESSTDNNKVSVTVKVLDNQTSDKLAPHVDSLTINSGAESTTDTLVILSMSATDPAGGTGVAELRYVEFEYSQGAKQWVPVWDSNWILNSQENANTFRRQLTSVGGIHYIQAWAKDGAGNISHYPYQQGIDYRPPTGKVGRDQTRNYRQELAVGASLEVKVKALAGDPDLYIWPPDWSSGRPPWVSNLTNQDDYFCFTAPVAGMYQIEIYGYSAAQFELAINASGNCANRTARQGGLNPAKSIPTQPIVDPNDQPPRSSDAPASVSHAVFLPVVE
jgi:hypothetical protein